MRSNIIKKNINLSFVFRLSGILVSYLLVSVTLTYLDQERYGIWVTLTSVLSWMEYLDFGLGNGLRNRLAESITEGKKDKTRALISTGYLIMLLFVLPVALALPFLSRMVDWPSFFKTNSVSQNELKMLVLLVGSLFVVNFVLSFLRQVLFSFQKAAWVSFSGLFSSFIALGSILLLRSFGNSSLLLLGIFLALSSTVSYLALSILFFARRIEFLPSYSYVDFRSLPKAASLGLKFFVIQIAGLVIFTTDNLIITRVLGPAEVTPYNISYKLFNVLLIVSTTILTPLWSGYTDAYYQKDYVWIERIIKKQIKLMRYVILIAGLLVLSGQFLIRIWTVGLVDVSHFLLLAMAAFTIISIWNNIFAYFVNGVGMLKPQIITAVVGAVINIPLSIFLARNLAFGSTGVIVASSVSLLPFSLVGPIQTRRILKSAENNAYNKSE